MIGIGIILSIFVGVSYLLTTGADAAGPTNPAADAHGGEPNTYWWVFIPAAVSIMVGIYLLFSPGKGFAETYDPSKQIVEE